MTISNLDDVIYSRDVIERIEELESALAEFLDATDGDDTGNFSDIDELRALRDLASEASQYSGDWKYGETLIRCSYWEDYVQEMLEVAGEIPQNLSWYIAIDWKKTSENIIEDYTTVEFDGVDYYIRSI